MEWLEIIKVQGALAGYRNADAELLKQLSQDTNSTDLISIRVYTHASVANDLVITLQWDTDLPSETGSTLALNLARELKRHGLVDHSVWIERLPEKRIN